MPAILPQQRLLLELLIMSGDIAVSDEIEDTILEKTLKECQLKGWVRTSNIASGYTKTTITASGRAIISRR